MTIYLKRSFAIAIFALFSTSAFADNSASAYTTDGMAVIGSAAADAGIMDEHGWTKVLETELSNSGNFKDLVIGLSFETQLMTETVVRSKGGNKSEATADAKIEMKVLVDGLEAAPGEVIFDQRTQTLWAKLGGVLNCIDQDGDNIVSFNECDLTDEEIGLILDTTAASTFNFLAYDIGSGSHTIQAFCRLTYSDEVVLADDGSSSKASASLGKGTLSVWEVHGAVGNN